MAERGLRSRAALGLALLVLAACGKDERLPPPPPGWEEILQRPDLRASLDTTTIVRSLYGTDLWVRLDRVAPKRLVGSRRGIRFTRRDVNLRVDCGARRVQTLHVRSFDATGKEVYERSAPANVPGTWYPFARHEAGEALLEELCVMLPDAPARTA